jgi:pyruvate dehydrogenase E1 component alpha subunit/2-oxoisovalerate dehydrogenase E1 component alpha subunit
MISHLGAMIPVVAGGLMARRFRGESGVVGATCLGDGGTSTGAFHEGLNVAAVEKLPLVVVLANNHYAYSTPNDRQFACKDLLDKAVGYGIAGHRTDGTDLADCLRVVGSAIEAARSGGGPQLVLGTLLRLVGHGEHDDAAYVDPKLKSAHVGRDCLRVSEEFLIEQQWASADQIAGWRAEAKKEVDAAAARVQREPSPDPAEEDWRAVSIASRDLAQV